MNLVTAALFKEIVGQYQLPLNGMHGMAHWARVLENGHRLAVGLAVDLEVVDLFAVFHDACRLNEGVDHDHGVRGAALADVLRGRFFELDDAAFALLIVACEKHTDGLTDAPPTVQVCWDADRLDLLRCGIVPKPHRLALAAARRPELLGWANQRAQDGIVPDVVTRVWRAWLDAPPCREP